MSIDSGLIAWVEEATEPLGRFSMRKMFGAAGLYIDGLIFAIVIGSELWFKADAEAEALFAAAGCERFTYKFADGRQGSMNYRQAPSEVHDDADAMRYWAGLALAASSRSRRR